MELDFSTFDRSSYLADQDNFLIDLPLEKSADASEERWLVQGIASCEVEDADGEEVIQKGLDTEPLMRCGYINWDHHDKEGPAYLIGEPIEVKVVQAQTYAKQLGKSLHGLALWVKGELYQPKRLARDTWEHIQATHGRARKLGWSIQGRVLQRDPMKKSRIMKSEVRHLAITHQPIQTYTFAELAKSFATTGMASPLLKENLNGRLTSVLYGDCKKGCYTRHGHFRKGRMGVYEHLTVCKGHDLKDVDQFMKSLVGNIKRTPIYT